MAASPILELFSLYSALTWRTKNRELQPPETMANLNHFFSIEEGFQL
jgi:hypothetical protein